VKSYNFKANSERPIVVGHRGVIFEEMENTLPAFRRAHEMGCDAVELDVFLLKCGSLVVFHGGGPEKLGSLEEHCGVNRCIQDLTYDEARELKMKEDCEEFVCPKDKIRNSKIPRLEEVLEFAKETGLKIYLELKGPGTPEPSLRLVERYGLLDQVIFSSFHMESLKKVRDLQPGRKSNGKHEVLTAALFEDVPSDLYERVSAVDASEIHLRYDTCSKERIDTIHRMGMGTLAWLKSPPLMIRDSTEWYTDIGNEEEKLFQIVMNSGVQAICTNRPDTLLNYLAGDCPVQ